MNTAIDDKSTAVVEELRAPGPTSSTASEPRPPTDANAQPQVRHAPRRPGRRTLLGIGIVLAVTLIGFLAAGTLPRLRHEKELNAAASEAARTPPAVSVVVARNAPPNRERLLPGNSLALFETISTPNQWVPQAPPGRYWRPRRSRQPFGRDRYARGQRSTRTGRATLALSIANLERDKANRTSPTSSSNASPGCGNKGQSRRKSMTGRSPDQGRPRPRSGDRGHDQAQRG